VAIRHLFFLRLFCSASFVFRHTHTRKHTHTPQIQTDIQKEKVS
jgi:hypothetical protein